jgi:putative transposase
MVTASTYRKQHHLSSRKRLRFFCERFFEGAGKHGWKLQAWAILANHYHFVALSPAEGKHSLVNWLGDLHRETAVFLNKLDGTPGRKVWHNYFDTPLTYQKSYLARLNYVQNNPVRHGLVAKAIDYDWCSASWFAKTASPVFQKTVASFKTDALNVYDDF